MEKKCIIQFLIILLPALLSAQTDTIYTQPLPQTEWSTLPYLTNGDVNIGLSLPIAYNTQGLPIVEHRPQKQGPLLPWNTSAYFKDRPKEKFLDWSAYGETLDGKQYTLWAMFAGAGVLYGMREAYHADPYCFERRWGVSPTSFWGSDAWKRNYVGNNPDNPHKSELFGNVGRDVWHTAGGASKTFTIVGSFAIGSRKQPAKYRVLNTILAWGIQSAFCSLTYLSLRS